MKWRLTFGDPKASHRTIWNSARTEIPAGIEPLPIEAAVRLASTKPVVQHVGWTLFDAVLVEDGDTSVDWLVPYPVARLAFDPTSKKDPIFRRVWRDPLARTIWLAVRYRHLVSQYYERECLAAAREIRRLKPTDVRGLATAMRIGMSAYGCGITEPFWSQFLPFVLGEKQLGYAFERTQEPEDAAVPA